MKNKTCLQENFEYINVVPEMSRISTWYDPHSSVAVIIGSYSGFGRMKGKS